MDTATSRSMTALCGVTVYARAEDGVGKPTVSRPPTVISGIPRTQTSSFLAPAPGLGIPQRTALVVPTADSVPSPDTPLHSTPHPPVISVIPCSCSWPRDSAVPAEPKLRHSLLLLLASGFRSTHRTQTSSFRAQSRNPCLASQRISQRSQRPLHSTMDTATSRSMTALCGVTVYARAEDGVGRPTVSRPPTRPCHSTPSRHFRSTRRTQTSSFLAPAPGLGIPQYPQNPNFVIPRAVAESMPR